MPNLKRLAACTACKRQYDASSHEPGARFHCACGEIVTVPTGAAHDAAVVRCSSCGGARQAGALACSFCNADFTLHEQDLHTLCPACMTRVSDRAKFCHSCAIAIAPQGAAGSPSSETCPTCEGDRKLFTREVDGQDVIVLECDRCAGVWVGHRIFEILEKRAQAQMATWGEEPLSRGPKPQTGKLYRACLTCGKLMHRRNYGKRSGLIVDVCHQHGIWFDQGELEDILDWVRSGGPGRAAERERLAVAPAGPTRPSPSVPTLASETVLTGGTVLGSFGVFLLDAIADFFLIER